MKLKNGSAAAVDAAGDGTTGLLLTRPPVERKGRGVQGYQASDKDEEGNGPIPGSLCLNDCSLNGRCDLGKTSGFIAGDVKVVVNSDPKSYLSCLPSISGSCLCEPGYFGSDCSIIVTPDNKSVPQLASLANYGLCNVRAKPCRDVVVLGDNFANHPSLVCVYETYRVRDKESWHKLSSELSQKRVSS